MISRGYITHSLNFYGDCFPFFYINIFKNKKKIKKKFYSYLDFFYKNWMNYDKKRVLITKFAKKNGIINKTSLKDGIDQSILWYLKNKKFINNFKYNQFKKKK